MFLLAAIFLYQAGGLGVTAGAHRLWAHRAYKAKWPLRLMLVIFNTLAFQVSNRNSENYIMQNFITWHYCLMSEAIISWCWGEQDMQHEFFKQMHNIFGWKIWRGDSTWRSESVLIISLENGDSMFFWNAGIYVLVNIESQPRRMISSSSPLWKSGIWHIFNEFSSVLFQERVLFQELLNWGILWAIVGCYHKFDICENQKMFLCKPFSGGGWFGYFYVL